MSPRRGRLLALALTTIFAGLAVTGALHHDRLLDTLHALRTGYYFDWMPEGVIPGSSRAINHAGPLGITGQRVFLFVGMVFFIIGLAAAIRQRRGGG